MPISQEQLAKRLRQERTRLELTQEEVADRLGVKRPTIAQIEAGNRAVTSIELAEFASLYRRDISDFLCEAGFDEPSAVMLLRADIDADDLPVRQNIDKCIEACEIATTLERILGTAKTGDAFSYNIGRPQSRWEAVEHGIRLADMERKRLNLGALPVRNIVEIISQHGVRVARYTLSENISGLFFVSPKTGKAILVNAGHHRATRRLYSYAHEYAHLLADSSVVPSGVSRYETRDDLLEVRANTFAAHFLMPEEGVRSYLDHIGGPSRQVMEIFDGFKDQYLEEELLTAQRRSVPYTQEVGMVDVLRLARHFGTSYSATLYHLLNLKIIQKDTHTKLMAHQQQSERMSSLLLGEAPAFLENEKMADLQQQTVGLIVEALYLKKLPKAKACEFMIKLDRDPKELEQLQTIA